MRPLTLGNCLLVFPPKFHVCSIVAEKNMWPSGNYAFLKDVEIQEGLTLGKAAAKSISRIPDSRETDVCTSWCTIVKVSANRRGENLAITITACQQT